MSVLADTGVLVVPGEVLYSDEVDGTCSPTSSSPSPSSPAGVTPGVGCYRRFISAGAARPAECQVVASVSGLAQWDGSVVSVYARRSLHQKRLREGDDNKMISHGLDDEEKKIAAQQRTETEEAEQQRSRSVVVGPKLLDEVHLRVTRVTRTMIVGEVIAINHEWCRHNNSSGSHAAYRGVVQVSDIRPFRPSKDSLLPPPPSAAAVPGDVVLAVVISQSDITQYQLSTLQLRHGVVRSVVRAKGSTGSDTASRWRRELRGAADRHQDRQSGRCGCCRC